MKPRIEDDQALAAQVEAIFRQANETQTSPSPYLKTRVLAEMRGRRRSARSVWFWKLSAAATSAVSLGLVAVLAIWPQLHQSAFVAFAGQPFLVKVELQDLNRQGISFASIELPQGVHFYSQKFPELKTQQRIDVSLAASSNGQLPFVINSDERGTKEIKLHFFDSNHRTVGEKIIHIRFDGEGKSV